MTLVVLLPEGTPAQSPGPGISLYRKLGDLGIDAKRIYKVRDGAIDREDIHISLNDGMIGLLEEASGEVTGAVFAGEGEVLLVPPNFTEKQSLALFTKSAVLNEKFTLAFFRFTDPSILRDLEPAFRDAEESLGFQTTYDPLARSLAQADALRVLGELTRRDEGRAKTHFFRARLSGVRLGIFDLLLDRAAPEQVFAGQLTTTEQSAFYDQWVMFPMRSLRQAAEASGRSPHFVDEVTIRSYKLASSVLPPTDIATEATLELDVAHGGSRMLVFELSRNLKVTSAVLNGQEKLEVIQNEALEGTQLARRGNDLVGIVFEKPLRTGERLRLDFKYAGAVMSDAGSGLLYVGSRGIWYPNRGPWMSHFDLEFRVPSGWKLLATGKPVSRQVTGEHEVSRWQTERPVPLAGFNLGKYVSATATSENGVRVEAYAAHGMGSEYAARQQQRAAEIIRVPRPFSRRGTVEVIAAPVIVPNPARNTKVVADDAAKTIDFLATRLAPFPFSSLALTQIPGADSQGWPGLIFLSSYVFLSPEERWQGRVDENAPDEILFARLMGAHEVAHQWWGNNIFYETYRDQWLIEALSNYCALLRVEHEDPKKFRIMLDSYRDGLTREADRQPAKDAGAVTLGVRLNSSKFPKSYDVVAYGRGTWLLHMLRHMFRDATAPAKSAARKQRRAPPVDPDAVFFGVLRELQQEFSGKVLSTTQMQAAFEAALPASLRFDKQQPLAWFFEGWVGGTAVPELTLEKVRIAGGRARGVIRQRKAPDSLVTSVPLYARGADGKLSYLARVFADGEETAVSLTVPAGTRGLALDPLFTVLRTP